MEELTPEMKNLIFKLYNSTLPKPITLKIAPQNSGGNPDLTKREFEIMELIARGLSNSEICEKLFIKESSLSTHRQAIYEKYQVKSITKKNDSVCRVKAVLEHLKRTRRLKDF